MNEFEEEPKPETGPAESAIPAAQSAKPKRRRRRGGRRHRRRPVSVPGTGAQIAAPESVKLAPAPEQLNSAPAPVAEPQTAEPPLAEPVNPAISALPAEQVAAAAPKAQPSHRRRHRGGRRHKRHDHPTHPPVTPVPGTPEIRTETKPPEEVSHVPTEPSGPKTEVQVSEAEKAIVPPEPMPAPIDLNGLVKKETQDGLRQLRVPGLDVNRAKQLLLAYLRDWKALTSRTKIVIGLSGGMNSALTACLAAEALGAEAITLVYLLDGRADESSHREVARRLAVRLRCALEVLDLRPMLHHLSGAAAGHRPPAALAALRYAVLADLAWRQNAALLLTQNRTARCLGAGVETVQAPEVFSLLGQMFAVQVRELARHLNLPGEIIGPREAWRDELGLDLSMEVLDGLLYQLLEMKIALAKLLELGAPEPALRTLYRLLKDHAQNHIWALGPDPAAVTTMRPWPVTENRHG
jgi:NH3-dependent NAD+ synthetase